METHTHEEEIIHLRNFVSQTRAKNKTKRSESLKVSCLLLFF